MHLLICQKLYWQQSKNIHFRQFKNTIADPKKDLSESDLRGFKLLGDTIHQNHFVPGITPKITKAPNGLLKCFQP